jgi:DNA-binding beta-propeller fold protein YncE
MAVLNADNGQWVTSLTTGPNTDALAYDFDRGLIYAANSGGDGSLTIIRQSVTDSYAVVQNLPTPHWARTLSLDPVTGLVYLAADYSDLEDAKRAEDSSGRGFQLLVIGH